MMMISEVMERMNANEEPRPAKGRFWRKCAICGKSKIDCKLISYFFDGFSFTNIDSIDYFHRACLDKDFEAYKAGQNTV